MARKPKKEILKPSQFKLPDDLVLWETNIPEEKRITLINPGDFPRLDILRSLGVIDSSLASSFGITDADEIRERQSIMRFIQENPEFGRWAKEVSVRSELPTSEQDFLGYFNSENIHNQHWEKVYKFIELVENAKGPIPNRLKTLVQVLKDSQALEADEKTMAKFIIDRILKVSVIEGLLTYRLFIGCEKRSVTVKKAGKELTKWDNFVDVEDIDVVDSHVHGHKMFSFDVLSAARQRVPDWAQGKLAEVTGINKVVEFVIDKINAHEERRAFQSMVITDISDGLEYDIARVVKDKFNSLRWEGRIGNFRSLDVKVYFSYSERGLQIRFYSLDPNFEIDNPYFKYDDSYLYSDPDVIKTIQTALKDYVVDANKGRVSLEGAKCIIDIEKQISNMFNKTWNVPSPEADSEYRWFALSNLYTDSTISQIVEASKWHRSFIDRQFQALRSIAWLGDKIEQKAKEIGSPICFPEIIEDGSHIVSFSELYPVHLLSRLKKDEKAIPIKGLCPINGTIIGLTGSNGGGKTVASLSISDNIFLAQSGLPVFGSDFMLNLKKVLGLVFIERGEGSTATMLLEKMGNILKGIEDVDGGDVVVILDELGSATQQEAGFELGKDMLAKLYKLKASVIFSTQIIGLSQYATNELGAICYKFDFGHNMESGIGDGGMEELRKRMGFDDLLLDNPKLGRKNTNFKRPDITNIGAF